MIASLPYFAAALVRLTAVQADTVPRRPDADSVMARVIAHRQARQFDLRAFSFRLTSKVSARDVDDSAATARSVLFFTETRSNAWHEAPDRYLEMVTARRRVGRTERGLAQIVEIGEPDPDRISLEELGAGPRPGGSRGRGGDHAVRTRYVVTLPVAADAKVHYAFAVIDTITFAGRAGWRLAFQPRNESEPSMAGTIDVADSTWEVLDIDASVGGAVRFPATDSLHFLQRYGDAGSGEWLPVLTQLTGEIRPSVTSSRVPREIAGIPIGGVPRHLRFEQLALRDSFDFTAATPGDIGEYRLVVAPDADRRGTGAWTDDTMPESDAERSALTRADSSRRHPGTLARLARDGDAAVRLAESPGFFHYNRVDGVYLGAAHDWPAGPLTLTTRAGYGFGDEVPQYRLGARVMLAESRRLWVGAWAYDETTIRPTFVSTGYNPTFRAFFARSDPLDYYREHGTALAAGLRVLDRTRLEVGYTDAWESTLDTIPGGVARVSRFPPRPNPPIRDGRMRALTGVLTWDSRAMVRTGEQDSWLGERSWTRVSLGLEAAAPSIIPDSFWFRRYTVRILHQRPTIAGTTTIAVAGGLATGDVPPQRYFTVDYGMGVLPVDGIQFNTLRRTNYYGTRALSIALRHDFDGRPFARSGLPLLRSLPFTLSLHGGVFWTDFHNHAALPGDSIFASAGEPYREAGFSIGNLTPFLAPINLSASFTWQLSSYPTQPFRFGIGLTAW